MTVEIQQQKAYWEQNLSKLEKTKSKDIYQMSELRRNILFCDNLLSKEENLMKEFQNRIVGRGKQKTDNSMVEIRDITYTRFRNELSFRLFPKILDWIQKNPYDLGVYLSSKIEGEFYHTEGGSRENLHIIVHDDSSNNTLFYSEDFESLFVEAVTSILHTNETRELIYHLLTDRNDIDQTMIKMWISYFSTPNLSITKQVMKGLIR
jgi:hypothetical protein